MVTRAAGRTTAVRKFVSGQIAPAASGLSCLFNFDTQLSEILGYPGFYGIDPKIPPTTLRRRGLRTTVIRHLLASKKLSKKRR